MIQVYRLFDLDASKKLAHELYQLMQTENVKVVTFEGELGAGKTFIISELIKLLMNDSFLDVTSPTFNIVNEYKFYNDKFYHFDLYRIENEQELHDIGFEEYLSNGVCIIEWPEHYAAKFIKDYKRIAIHIKLINQSSTLTIREASVEVLT